MMMLLCAFSFGAIVKVALADSYHVACVAHGFLSGESRSDGSFFARVEAGCGGGSRSCDIFVNDSFKAGVASAGSSTCNAWSRNYGNYTECAGSAHVDYSGAFGRHAHNAPGYCPG